MFDEDDLAEFADLIDLASQEFVRTDGAEFTAAIEEDKASISTAFGGDFAENYPVKGRTAMLYLKPGVKLSPNDQIVASRTRITWLVHAVIDSAFPDPTIRLALMSISPM